MAHVFIGEVPGYFNPELTMEDVRDNWGQITDRSEFSVPNSTPEETGMFIPFLR